MKRTVIALFVASALVAGCATPGAGALAQLVPQIPALSAKEIGAQPNAYRSIPVGPTLLAKRSPALRNVLAEVVSLARQAPENTLIAVAGRNAVETEYLRSELDMLINLERGRQRFRLVTFTETSPAIRIYREGREFPFNKIF